MQDASCMHGLVIAQYTGIVMRFRAVPGCTLQRVYAARVISDDPISYIREIKATDL